MVSLARPEGDPSALRALHDRLERAYFALARTSARWFEMLTPRALCGGFAGLDSPTMNRLALLEAADERDLDDALMDAGAFFAARRLGWSAQLTPFSRPANAAALLRRRGFHLVSELSVMTLSPLAELPPRRAPHLDVDIRPASANEIGRFTQLTIEAFRMPPRFYPALTDVNRAWVDAGATAYLALHDGQPVGTALITRHAGVAGIYNVATARQHRGRGVATSLMRRAMTDFRDFEEDVLTLQVARGSTAESFYERIGFRARYGWELYTRDG